MSNMRELLPRAGRRERLLNARRGITRSAHVLARWQSTQDRPLPNIVILGTQRGGTTSLFADLALHPQVIPPIGKELDFFTLNYGRGERWYRGHFPHLEPGQQTLDATPYYMFHPGVPARASAMLPYAKFVVLLRDPVKRAYSHYQHNRALDIEPLSFEEALDAEDMRLARAVSLGLDSPEGERLHRNFSYVSRGLYAPQLERWLAVVPKARLQVLKSEDFYREPHRVYGQLLHYLGLAPFVPDGFAKTNVRGSSRESLRTAPTATFAELRQRFVSDTERVCDLLGWASAWHSDS